MGATDGNKLDPGGFGLAEAVRALSYALGVCECECACCRCDKNLVRIVGGLGHGAAVLQCYLLNTVGLRFSSCSSPLLPVPIVNLAVNVAVVSLLQTWLWSRIR